MSFNLKSILKTALPEGNKLVEEANLATNNLSNVQNQFTNDVTNATALFEGSNFGGVEQFEQFKNTATAEMETLKHNIAPVLDKTIQAVTSEMQGVAMAAGIPISNKAINANGEVVAGNLDLGQKSGDPRQFAPDDPLASADAAEETGEDPKMMDDVTVHGTRPQRNPLERYVSANYVITLSCLTNDELADPDGTYMKNGPQIIILKSGGGTQGIGKKKATTAMEGKHGRTEYFIEDLNIRSIISPNPKSRTSAYHQMTFRIVEPYSMGQFLEALEIGARTAGHVNYIGAPFMLSIDWVGYLQEPSTRYGLDFNDNVGDVIRLSKMNGQSERHLPIMITNATFNVTTKGTEYNCTAIAYNGGALTDLVQKVPIDVAISGGNVETLLQSGKNSLATVLNTNLLKREKGNERSYADEYVILFPTKEESAAMGTKGKSTNTAVSPHIFSEEEAEKKFHEGNITSEEYKKIKATTEDFSYENWAQKILGISIKRNDLSEQLKVNSFTQTNINKIGEATIVFDKLQDGAQEPNPEGLIYDSKKKIHVTSAINISRESRELKFKKGTKVNKIIEEVVLLSEFGRGLLDRAIKPSGAKEWFRIETQVFNIPIPEVEVIKGRPPKIYVFRVVPYDVNISLIEKPTEVMHGEDDIRNHIVKYYEYMYTGQNKDIQDIEINFENRFLTPVSPDKGSNQTDVKSQGNFATSQQQRENHHPMADKEGAEDNITGPLRKVGAVSIENPTASVRGVPGNEKEDIARTFHNALVNHTVDLMQLKLKIWGDPYYISDSGVGNYNSVGAGKGKKSMIDPRGQMVYKSKQVFVNVGFRTPIDYGSNGIAVFNTPNDNENKASTELEKFSGIYWVTEVESTFAAGRFDQTLTMLRQRNQARQAKNVKKAAKDSESGTALTEAKYREMIDGPPGTVQTGLATRTSVASTGSPHRRVG